MTIGLPELEALYVQIDGQLLALPDNVRSDADAFRLAYRDHRLGSKAPEALRDARTHYPAAKKAIDDFTEGASSSPDHPTKESREGATPVLSGEIEPRMPVAVSGGGVIDASAVAGYPDHPAAAIFPMLSDADLTSLAEDIKQNGLVDDITIFEGKVLDGRNRQRACPIAGVKRTYTEWSGTGSPVDWVLSRNLHRRHLTDQQRVLVAAEAMKAYSAEAEERRLANLRQNREPIESANLRSREPASAGSGSSAAQAAKALGVKIRAVEKASQVIKSGDKALVDAMKKGEVSLDAASLVSGLPVEEQKKLVQSGEVKAKAASMRKEKEKKKPETAMPTLPREPPAPDSKGAFHDADAGEQEKVSDTQAHLEGDPEIKTDVPSEPGPVPPVCIEADPHDAEDAGMNEPCDEVLDVTSSTWILRPSRSLMTLLAAMMSQYRLLTQMLPDINRKLLQKVLVEHINSDGDEKDNLESAATRLFGRNYGVRASAIELAKLPPEGVDSEADDLRAKTLKYIAQGRSTDWDWSLGVGQRVEKILYGDVD